MPKQETVVAEPIVSNGNNSVQEAKLLIREREQERVNAASEAIQSVLKQYHCALIATPSIAQDGRIQAAPAIQALPED